MGENNLNDKSYNGSTEAGISHPLISVIVPVYNVQAYLSACLDSLLCQTYKNLEIILIDDGSGDGSGEICDEYARADERICVIHQKNSGPSEARNAGLNRAHGEYIAFVDGDDEVSPVYIESLYQLLVKFQADISICGYVRGGERVADLYCGVRNTVQGDLEYYSKMTDNRDDDQCRSGGQQGDGGYSGNETRADNRHGQEQGIQEICLDSEQMLRQWHDRYKQYETVVWNKLYHASVFNGGQGRRRIRYPACERDEDIIVSHQIIQNADKLALTTQTLYLYRNRPGSLTAENVMIEHMKQNLSAQKERLDFFREKRYWRAYLNLLKGYVLHAVWFGWKRLVRLLQKRGST